MIVWNARKGWVDDGRTPEDVYAAERAAAKREQTLRRQRANNAAMIHAAAQRAASRGDSK